MSKKSAPVEIALPYTPPFDWPGVLAFFQWHEMRGIEAVGADHYSRVFRIGETSGHVHVVHDAANHRLLLSVTADGKIPREVIEKRIRRMFALDADLTLVGKGFAGHKVLGPLWKSYPGLRPSSGWDAFESSVSTILGQLVSVKRAKDLAWQLVQAYGEKIVHPVTGETAYLFPTPARLAEAGLEEIGTTQVRKRTIREFSRRVLAGELDLSGTDIVKTKAALLSITGIGPWSSEYIALRALANTDSFPGADLILKRATDNHPGLDLAKLSPWKSYAAVLFWRHHVETAALVPVAVKKPKRPKP